MKVSDAGDFEVAFLEELKQEISSTAIAVFCSNKDIYEASTSQFQHEFQKAGRVGQYQGDLHSSLKSWSPILLLHYNIGAEGKATHPPDPQLE